MGARKKQQPTKVQAVFTGLLALFLLTNTAMKVLVEGQPATVLFWIVMALDLSLLALSLWLYRRAMKLPLKVD
jgi:low temperature requirement protein LtrA